MAVKIGPRHMIFDSKATEFFPDATTFTQLSDFLDKHVWKCVYRWLRSRCPSVTELGNNSGGRGWVGWGGRCFMGGSAQLLEPHRMHRIPQTDRRGGVPVECGGAADCELVPDSYGHLSVLFFFFNAIPSIC